MCWLVQKPAGKTIPADYIVAANKFNKDGYGLSYFDGSLQVFKTMDFKELLDKLATLTDKEVILHLRAASIGNVTLDNAHPFPIPNGVLYHNGTMTNMKTISCEANTCANASDTKNLAELISKCTYNHLSDILPLVHQIVGTTGNKIVFHENDGTVTILNKHLGSEEDGIWYSSSYHKTYSNYTTSLNNTHLTYKVFVYGTLKKGGANHYILQNSKFIGEATTATKYAMIGENMPYPYLLEYNAEKGHLIKGEVYEVTKQTLGKLDILEGVPYHYERKTIGAKLTDTNTYMTVVTYIKANITQANREAKYIDEFKLKTYIPSTSTSNYYMLEDEAEEYIEALDVIANYKSTVFYTKAKLRTLDATVLYSHVLELTKAYYNTSTPQNFVETNLTIEEYIETVEWLYECILDETNKAQAIIDAYKTPTYKTSSARNHIYAY